MIDRAEGVDARCRDTCFDRLSGVDSQCVHAEGHEGPHSDGCMEWCDAPAEGETECRRCGEPFEPAPADPRDEELARLRAEVETWKRRWFEDHSALRAALIEGAFSVDRDPLDLQGVFFALQNGQVSTGQARTAVRRWLAGLPVPLPPLEPEPESEAWLRAKAESERDAMRSDLEATEQAWARCIKQRDDAVAMRNAADHELARLRAAARGVVDAAAEFDGDAGIVGEAIDCLDRALTAQIEVPSG